MNSPILLQVYDYILYSHLVILYLKLYTCTIYSTTIHPSLPNALIHRTINDSVDFFENVLEANAFESLIDPLTKSTLINLLTPIISIKHLRILTINHYNKHLDCILTRILHLTLSLINLSLHTALLTSNLHLSTIYL